MYNDADLVGLEPKLLSSLSVVMYKKITKCFRDLSFVEKLSAECIYMFYLLVMNTYGQ